MFLEDKKNTTFLKINDVIAKLGGPPPVWDSMLISSNEMESKVSNHANIFI